MIDKKGGKQWYFGLYKKRNEKIRQGIEKLGLSTFPKRGYESPTVNCIGYPRFTEGGLLRPSVQHCWRRWQWRPDVIVGNMGYIEMDDIDLMLKALGDVLSH